MSKMSCFIRQAGLLFEKPIANIGVLDALTRINTTICGTDFHIPKGEYPGRRGLTIGHEPVEARQSRRRLPVDDYREQCVLVRCAMVANLAPIPEECADEQALMRPDIMSTSCGRVESSRVRVSHGIAIFAGGRRWINNCVVKATWSGEVRGLPRPV